MADNCNNNSKIRISEDTMHKKIVPILHASLWFLGLLATKYAATWLGVAPNKENVLNMLNVLPAFIVFILEIAVTFQDIRVSHHAGQLLHMQTSSFFAKFCLIVGVVAFFGILYAIKPKAEWMFIMLMLSSVVMKHMEYFLLNNLDTYIVEKPRDISEVIYEPTRGFSRKNNK